MTQEGTFARFTILSNMHNDLIGEIEMYPITQKIWKALKSKFGLMSIPT